jgi:hypothetical protein
MFADDKPSGLPKRRSWPPSWPRQQTTDLKVDPAETSIIANTARQVPADFFRSKT